MNVGSNFPEIREIWVDNLSQNRLESIEAEGVNKKLKEKNGNKDLYTPSCLEERQKKEGNGNRILLKNDIFF